MPPEREAALSRVEREGSEVLAKAERLFEQGRLAEAEAGCREVNRIWQSKGGRMASNVAHLLGRIRMRQGRYADAARIMAPNIDDIDLQKLDLALCYVRIGDLAGAQRFADPSLITDHNSAFGDVRRFVPTVRSARDLEGTLLWCKGVALSDVGRPSEAADCYAAALRLLPGNALLAARFGAAAENAGRFEEAARAYRIVQSASDPSMRRATAQAFAQSTERAGRAKQARPTLGP